MQLNRIEVNKRDSKYGKDHYCIIVDGIPLDEWLHSCCPEEGYEGLIPTLSVSMEPREEDLVLCRYQSADPIVRLPVLMCPDDCDLWCTVIVVEVERRDGLIRWNRFGADRSTRDELIQSYECIGKRVDWLNNVPSLIFEQAAYNTQISKLWQA